MAINKTGLEKIFQNMIKDSGLASAFEDDAEFVPKPTKPKNAGNLPGGPFADQGPTKLRSSEEWVKWPTADDGPEVLEKFQKTASVGPRPGVSKEKPSSTTLFLDLLSSIDLSLQLLATNTAQIRDILDEAYPVIEDPPTGSFDPEVLQEVLEETKEKMKLDSNEDGGDWEISNYTRWPDDPE